MALQCNRRGEKGVALLQNGEAECVACLLEVFIHFFMSTTACVGEDIAFEIRDWRVLCLEDAHVARSRSGQ